MPHPVRPRHYRPAPSLGHGFIVFPDDPRPTPLEYYAIYDLEPPEADAEEDDGEEKKDDPWRKWR